MLKKIPKQNNQVFICKTTIYTNLILWLLLPTTKTNGQALLATIFLPNQLLIIIVLGLTQHNPVFCLFCVRVKPSYIRHAEQNFAHTKRQKPQNFRMGSYADFTFVHEVLTYHNETEKKCSIPSSYLGQECSVKIKDKRVKHVQNDLL